MGRDLLDKYLTHTFYSFTQIVRCLFKWSFFRFMMSGPPTPVTACPLVCLEIRDGASFRAYSSTHPHNAFTLTIEGERPIDTDMGALVILIHKGMQQAVSLRLGEINSISRPPDDIIRIDKYTNRMCVSVPGMPQSILVQFKEKRDFSVAVCVLQMTGFHINETIPASLIMDHSRGEFQTLDTTANLGPRLSSITPLFLSPTNEFQEGAIQPDLSFTTMLNTPFQPPPLQSTQSQAPHPRGTYSDHTQLYASPNQGADVAGIAAQLNPYNIFLGRGSTHSHVPRVSSSLRHSFDSNSYQTQTSFGTSGTQSSGDMLTDSLMNSTANHKTSGVGIPQSSHGVTMSGHQPLGSSREKFSPRSYSQQSSNERPHEFRNLMPRPRKLPFESRTKRGNADARPESQRDGPVDNEKVSGLINTRSSVTLRARTSSIDLGKRLTANHSTDKKRGGKSRLDANEDTLKKLSAASKTGPKPGDCSLGLDSVTTPPGRKLKENTYKEANHPAKDTRTVLWDSPDECLGTPELESHPLDLDTTPCVVVVDPDTLRESDQATATLFEQYERDIADGGEKGQYAEFYLDQIWTRRRDFWLGKLHAMRG